MPPISVLSFLQATFLFLYLVNLGVVIMSTSQTTNNDKLNQNNANNKPPISTENLAKTQFQVEGMSCQACATRIEKVLNKKPAIASASVSFAGETLNVSYDASQSNADQISE